MQLLTRKFTVEQYHQMAEQGILDHQEHLELIQGEIITMSPIGFRHAFVTTYLSNWFARQLGQKTIVYSQNPIQLNNKSQPQPDVALLKPVDDFYDYRLPGAEDILLLIEVADSSLTYDQTIKVPLYAQHQIPEVWLIDLTQNILQCYLEPEHNSYKNQRQFSPNQSLFPKAFPELELTLNRIFT
ncbi:Uma2 family endonuclease (plasmid) [Synechocystis sp. PCC 7339]|uniref:Uma2 family endonuclease n=1 Tax=unclassified Synechocystis TaxID=2640012 RepID=UPI001BAF6D50|nr:MULTISPECIES: Uma2 family endonuclease [unclassified Synechocystis]QUS62538.1 Uma2 family endonuclease [Synechocystis sp. PCC 7338]UAJ74648.1 Uma2 family endonuclease [Synechocystis sp. PCC 7339]